MTGHHGKTLAPSSYRSAIASPRDGTRVFSPPKRSVGSAGYPVTPRPRAHHPDASDNGAGKTQLGITETPGTSGPPGRPEAKYASSTTGKVSSPGIPRSRRPGLRPRQRGPTAARAAAGRARQGQPRRLLAKPS